MASNNPYYLAINNGRLAIHTNVDDVTANSVIDRMLGERVLRPDQYDELRACITPGDRKQRLADMLVGHAEKARAFASFCKALEQEGKNQLVDQLMAELCRQLVLEQQRPGVDGGDVCGYVLSAHRLAIDSGVHDIDNILDHLQSDEALNNEQCELLKAFTSLTDRRHHLVNMVICLAGKPGVFESFCNALVGDNNAGLANTLRSESQQRGRQPGLPPPPSLAPAAQVTDDNWTYIGDVRLRQVTHDDMQQLAKLVTKDRFDDIGQRLGFIDTQMAKFRSYSPHCLEIQALQMFFAWYNKTLTLKRTVGLLVPLLRQGGIDTGDLRKVFCRHS